MESHIEKAQLIEELRNFAEPFTTIQQANLQSLIDRIGDSPLVLLGESTHGTAEFYQMRAKITQELIKQKGFSIVAVEADWPDASIINHYVHGKKLYNVESKAFNRFPFWMWRNVEFHLFMEWLKNHNQAAGNHQQVGFYGLDLYSMYTSIQAVIHYLKQLDPHLAQIAIHDYSSLKTWKEKPSNYGLAVALGQYQSCEEKVVSLLIEILNKRLEYTQKNKELFIEAAQNARLVANAESYYRAVYSNFVSSWNIRDQHMFETLEAILDFKGNHPKAVIWEHNSHIGDASATTMGENGEWNLGELARLKYEKEAVLIGFGTDHGEVAAATHWDGPLEFKSINPAQDDSFEFLCHQTGIENFILSLRNTKSDILKKYLAKPMLERAIGVIYRPETELQSHYFKARLISQFDEYIWFDATNPITPFGKATYKEVPDTWPFGY